jgi:hypothetical protein
MQGKKQKTENRKQNHAGLTGKRLKLPAACTGKV